MSVVFNSQHELRSGWKVLIYVIVLLVSFVVGAIFVSLFFADNLVDENEIEFLAINVGVQLIASIIALLFMARFVDRVPASTFAFPLRVEGRREFLTGAGIATAMLVIVIICCMLLGDLTIERNAASALSILSMGLVLLAAAAFEELVFRGYPLQTLIKGLGQWPAVLLTSILFGLAHLSNPNASTLGIINTVLAGLLLCFGYLQTRRLWLPYGLHFVWNAGLGLILGFSLSGINTASVWITTVRGPDVLVGGEYGPEGGVAGTITFIAAMGFFFRLWKNRNQKEENQETQ
jgi:membrane protease YdiL (CAAX protease family)